MTSSAPTPEDAEVFLERAMEEVEVRPFCGGTAVVFSTRSPAKETPNEDAAALVPFDGKSGVIAVADGAGGTRGGAQAACITVYELCASLENVARSGGILREAILDGIEGANREVSALAIGAASTLALVEVRGMVLRPYHVGDSEILVVGQRGKLKLQTVSHSPTGYALESGLIDELEAMQHEDRHFVSNIVGVPDMRIEMGAAIDLSPRDTVVVACDGLFDNLSSVEIIELLRKGSLPEATTELVRTCRERMVQRRGGRASKPDDLTLVTFRLDADE